MVKTIKVESRGHFPSEIEIILFVWQAIKLSLAEKLKSIWICQHRKAQFWDVWIVCPLLPIKKWKKANANKAKRRQKIEMGYRESWLVYRMGKGHLQWRKKFNMDGLEGWCRYWCDFRKDDKHLCRRHTGVVGRIFEFRT